MGFVEYIVEINAMQLVSFAGISSRFVSAVVGMFLRHHQSASLIWSSTTTIKCTHGS